MNPFNYWNDFLENDSEDTDWSFAISSDDVKRLCSHEFVEMGFMHSKIVCKLCDIPKEDWDKFVEGKKK